MNITSRGAAAHCSPSRMQPSVYAEKVGLCIWHVKGSANEHREEEMKNQTENQNEKMECRSNGAAFAFLVAGLGVGAALSVFLAPKSGAETRKWIATKCLDGIDSANLRVRQARLRMHELVDQGQQKVSEAVTARREAFGKETPEAEVKES